MFTTDSYRYRARTNEHLRETDIDSLHWQNVGKQRVSGAVKLRD